MTFGLGPSRVISPLLSHLDFQDAVPQHPPPLPSAEYPLALPSAGSVTFENQLQLVAIAQAGKYTLNLYYLKKDVCESVCND